MAGRRSNKVDPNDLIDAGTVADLLGLKNADVASTYARRYKDDGFPQPVIERASGRCKLWLRQEVEAYGKANPPARPGARRRARDNDHDAQ